MVIGETLLNNPMIATYFIIFLIFGFMPAYLLSYTKFFKKRIKEKGERIAFSIVLGPFIILIFFVFTGLAMALLFGYDYPLQHPEIFGLAFLLLTYLFALIIWYFKK